MTNDIKYLEKVKAIILEYIKYTNNILEENTSYNIDELVFIRNDIICISNETNLCVHDYDMENDWELSGELCVFLRAKLKKENLETEYHFGAFEIYPEVK